MGHVFGRCDFKVARCALDTGFTPDTMSTDLYNTNAKGPVFDMPATMSKMLYLGMSFEEAPLRATANPGRIISRVPGMGTLEIGAPANIALPAIEDGQFRLIDAPSDSVSASKRIVSRLTICRGRRVTTPVSSRQVTYLNRA